MHHNAQIDIHDCRILASATCDYVRGPRAVCTCVYSTCQSDIHRLSKAKSQRDPEYEPGQGKPCEMPVLVGIDG